LNLYFNGMDYRLCLGTTDGRASYERCEVTRCRWTRLYDWSRFLCLEKSSLSSCHLAFICCGRFCPPLLCRPILCYLNPCESDQCIVLLFFMIKKSAYYRMLSRKCNSSCQLPSEGKSFLIARLSFTQSVTGWSSLGVSYTYFAFECNWGKLPDHELHLFHF